MPNRVLHVMGMAVSIDIRAEPPDLAPLEAAVAQVGEWLEWVDGVFSTYKDDSDVSRIARGELAVEDAAPQVGAVLALGERFRECTGGYFDVRAGGRLDPSGVVKGWAVEQASALLLGAGFADHAVNAGGDIRMRGRPGAGRRWRVGIAHPHVQGGLAAVAAVEEGAVATSGTAERGAHVIDPHTGQAALELASVTVVGPELVATDVYATAALAMGDAAPRWLSELEGYEAFVVRADAGTWHTAGFPFA